MRLLIVWHAGGVKSYWKRFKDLSNHFKEVRVLIPEKWNEGGREVNSITTFLSDNCSINVGKTFFAFHDATHIYVNNLYKLLKSYKPDIIHIHEEPWSMCTFQVILLNRILNINAKIIIDSAAISTRKLPFPFSWIEKFTYNNADLFFARNKEVKQILVQRGCRSPIYLLPNGLDTDKFKKLTSNEIKHKKSKINIEDSNLIIGYVGRMVREKGIYDFIEAGETLINEGYNQLRFLMIGSGPEYNSVTSEISRRKLEKYFIIKERIDSEAVPVIMNIINILVLPSRTTANWKEQFGRVLVEAMACETAVVGSDSGAIPEVIGDERFVFREGDVEDLVSKLRLLIDNQELYKEVLVNNKERAIKQYSWQSLAKYYKEILEKQGMY
ncbi:glycosyltransferase [Geobacillus zalihae]|uniref:glycosyltransferase n=1 Tax=Geobacillus zalihae TaxID=213419 RepID=UPI000763F3B6|nr:glycosyltransferase [Geobacillus zalihae]